MAASSLRPNLLFAHGSGLCKETWNPILKHLKASPLFQRVAFQLLPYDLPFHGESNDNSSIDQVQVTRKNGKPVGAYHPVLSNWIDWAPKKAHEMIRSLPNRREQPLIGIGHSMGATSMWINEIRKPGTFDKLILFEPPVDTPVARLPGTDFLVSSTLCRDFEWNSRQEIEKSFRAKSGFSSWHPEVLQAYLDHAIVRDQASGKWRLAILPPLEASIYAGDLIPMTKELIKKPKCQVSIFSGGSSHVVSPRFAEYFHKQVPSIYNKVQVIPKTTHSLVLEDPIACAEGILQELEQMDVFKA